MKQVVSEYIIKRVLSIKILGKKEDDFFDVQFLYAFEMWCSNVVINTAMKIKMRQQK